MPITYNCKECGGRVYVSSDGTLVRACVHSDAGVTANMSATATRGCGGLAVRPSDTKPK